MFPQAVTVTIVVACSIACCWTPTTLAKAPSSSSPHERARTTKTTNERPWWWRNGDNDPSGDPPVSSLLRTTPSAEWQPVDPDWSWDQRQTGILPDWTCYFGVWKHYNESTLQPSLLLGERQQRAADDDDYDAKPLMGTTIVPWTQGRMCKFLRQLNHSAFELCSLYEPCALGQWMGGSKSNDGGALSPRELDGLIVNRYTFVQTPFRVTQLPFVQLPAVSSSAMSLPAAARQSRVTIVQPHAATYAGPRWLPTLDQHATFLRHAPKDDGVSVHFHFAELWLAEPVVCHGATTPELHAGAAGAAHTNNDNRTSDQTILLEGRKMGLFCQYDTLTGKLIQIFRMREVLVPESVVATDWIPYEALSLDEIESQLQAKWPAWSSRDHLAVDMMSSSLASDLLNREKSLAEIIQQHTWRSYEARVVKTSPDRVQEEACERRMSIQNDDSPQNYYYSPAEQYPDDYFDCRFDDGVYARIPKTMLPSPDNDNGGGGGDDRELCLEMGAITQSGDLHRLLATGSRSGGGLHCLVYEKWMK